ncbi:MAG: hypothetical protein OJF50_000660 [Nitrospira sp.]|jgi:hypothetical protein|nr:hypothetical protein [Nitrospira sp.]
MGKADSCDIALHIRTVHFALVVTCILVALSYYGYSASEHNAAYKQFEYISTIKTDWMIWTKRFGTEQIKWLKDQGLGWPDEIPGEIHVSVDELARENLPQRDHGWTARPHYSPVYLHLSVSLPSGSRHEILGAGFPQEDGIELIPGGHHAVGKERLDTLEEFRQFWNASNNVVAFTIKDISKVAYIASNGEIKAELPWINRPRPRQGTQIKLGRMNIGLKEGVDYCKDVKGLLASNWSPQFNVLFCGLAPSRPSEQPSQILVLPAQYKDEQVPVNLRIWLGTYYKFPSVGRKFEETFPDLYAFTKNNMNMQFGDVERLLQSEMQRERFTEKVDVFGFKFRERDLASWGALFIVIVQIYLVAHLRELNARQPAAEEWAKAAWIGLYNDFLARFVSLLTASALPIAVHVYGIALFGFSWPVFSLLAIGTLLSSLTAWLLLYLPTRQTDHHLDTEK